MTIATRAARRGFTLIELLVVIAIIGILSSVVLASLNTARNRGADAAIRSNLNNARPQAELFFDQQSPNSYTNVCTGTNGLSQFTTGATNAGGTNVQCASDANAWAAQSQLRSTTEFYCVDSTGLATTTSSDTVASSGDYSCAP
jgi:prepilin-type N-terminal cleavage/methylation domain-containing protein